MHETTRKRTSEMDVVRNKVLNLLYIYGEILMLGYKNRGLD